MFGMSFTTPRKTMRGAGSTAAMALVLATGAVAGTAAFGTDAHAQRRNRDQAAEAQYSPAFVAVYQPLSEVVNAEGGDLSSVRGQLDGVVSAAQNADERNLAGNLLLVAGNKLQDPALQRRGLDMMLQSGKVPAENVGQYQFFLGNLAYNAQDWAASRTALQAAVAAGYTQDNAEGLLAETYFRDNQPQQGIDFISGLVQQKQAAGQPADQQMIRRALQAAYEADLAPQATELSAMLVAAEPTKDNWTSSLQVVNAMNDLDPQAQLDLLRLMMVTDAMTDRREFVTYIEAADVRVMANEVQRVLDKGTQQGIFSPSDEYYAEVKRLADQRAPIDRQEAPGLASEAQSSANGTAAQGAGDVYMSLADYAQAETMYQLALEKGGVDADRNRTRLGIAQALQGKADAAKTTLAQVSGARAPVARMWTVYADSSAA